MADRYDESSQSDLEWYFNWSDGDLCSPSNYMAMVAAIRLGGARSTRSVAPDIFEGRLLAARKVRRLSRALEHLDAVDRRVLRFAFGPNAHALPVLGDAAPIAPLTLAAQAAHQASGTTRSLEEWLTRLTWRVSQRLGDRLAEDGATARAVAAEANRLLRNAVRAFEKALRPRRTESGIGSQRQATQAARG